MARSSPGAARVAAILNFMADHPGQAFALTDLVRALKLSRATCHALLTALVEVGYLFRTSDKSYVLGPALANICRAVSKQFSPLQVAQPEMRLLADMYDVVCSVYVLEGQTVSVRERASSMSHLGVSVPVGTRLKLRVPFAAPYFFRATATEVEKWLDETDPPATPEQRSAFAASMAFARRHGFVMLFTDGADASAAPAEQIFGDETSSFPVVPATEDPDPGKSCPVASILAPVFDAEGKVVFVMGLTGFNRMMIGAEVDEIAARLMGACGRITSYIGGPARQG